ncbi:hypothetical protein IY145_01275 [Methylosinus sp. H3A]|uniref:hypothetical protein n=1 Tax=Methylosinus sp. H3A TaxID=2785786 RepID=UPI0018C2D937|nr:hypothetical protein [Methylosinus sp. H3A]MBG0808049.1 hypothetical protein [Methylosinus sp. H3A]
MTSHRAWMLLKSGGRLDLLDPKPDAWTDEDLAIGLSRAYRWGGHSAWDLPLSVAQHSLAVLALRERKGKLTPRESLRELLHDATELSTLSEHILIYSFWACAGLPAFACNSVIHPLHLDTVPACSGEPQSGACTHVSHPAAPEPF